MTPHKREVMQMALNALEIYGAQAPAVNDTIEALHACLAQPEQYDQTELALCKKCGWKAVWPDGCLVCEKQKVQPEKEWVGLTDEEYELMAEKRVTNYFFNTLDYAHDIETKLKEKNT